MKVGIIGYGSMGMMLNPPEGHSGRMALQAENDPRLQEMKHPCDWPVPSDLKLSLRIRDTNMKDNWRS